MKTKTIEQIKADKIEFDCAKESAAVFHEWLQAKGREQTIAACVGTVTAAIGMLQNLCGEKETYDYLQRKADETVKPRLVHD